MHPQTTTICDFLRHGEPVGGRRFRGHTIDDPLSAKGWDQMRTTAASVSGWQRVICSPLQRCRAFAAEVAAQRSLPLQVLDDLREVGFGQWEGCSPDELIAATPVEYDAFYADPVANRPPGAEPLDAFAARVIGALDQILDQHPGEHILVVAHAGVLRAVLGHVLRAPPQAWYRARVDNAAITRIRQDGHGLALVAHNWCPSGPS